MLVLGSEDPTDAAGILRAMVARGSPRSPDEPRRRDRMEHDPRVQLAQVLAFVALVAALVGALGPAEKRHAIYDWPPPTLPSGTPSRAWYTPLLLTRHRAEAVAANVPCVLPAALADAERPVTVLATSRFPERNEGLAVIRRQGQLVVRIGGIEVMRTALKAGGSAGGECSYRLSLAGGRWMIDGGPEEIERSGVLPAMPVVTGLFSGLDLGSATAPTIRVTTAVHGSRPRTHQTIAWALAAICVSGALFLVAFGRLQRPRRALGRGTRNALTRFGAPDAVVAIALPAWCVLSPAFHDDGWVVARQRTFSSSGGFASYYNAFGVHYPGDYWLEWLQHWLVESTSALVFLRIPALLCLAATWVLARWILSRIVLASAPENGLALWTLTSAFLIGAFSWGMTLRPEPVTALFVTAVLACIVRFLERGTAAPLAALGLLLPFALTAHHAAVVAFAPLLVAAPSLVRWARSQIAVASTIIASAIALFAVLLFVGADLEQRSADAQTLASVTGASWRGEILRYLSLSSFPFGTPLRRAFVALALVTVLAFLLRGRRERQPLLDLPAASLGVSLVLLIATPSKFPWHFGALIGVAAVALAAEIARLRRDSLASTGWAARPLLVLGAAVLAVAWSWTPRSGWGALDLRTLDWKLGLETWLPLSTVVTVLPVVVLAAAIVIARRDRAGRARAPWLAASWAVPIVAAPLLAFTIAVLAADAVRTDSWTLTRQNLGALRGDAGCGLGDDVRVPAVASLRPLFPAARTANPRELANWTPPSPLAGLARFSLGPGESETDRSPWLRIGREKQFGFFIAGTPRSSDRLGLDWGRERQGRVRTVGVERLATTFTAEAGASLPWRFVASGELPRVAEGATAVRITLRSDASPGAAVAVTAPVGYVTESLTRSLNSGASGSLVFPHLVTYLPCVSQARLGEGIVEVPSHILISTDADSPVREPDSSPFAGVLDLYDLERLPVADSAIPPGDLAVFRVNRVIPGATEAPPMQSTVGG
jgi:hypothetical protein